MVDKGDRPLSVLHVQPVRLVEELTKAWTVYSACNAGNCLPKKEVEYELRPMESPHPKAQKASPPRQLEAKIFIIACTWGGALGKIILVLFCMPSLAKKNSKAKLFDLFLFVCTSFFSEHIPLSISPMPV